MSAIERLDPTLASWLEAGPRELPEVTRQAIVEAVRVTPQGRRRPVVRPDRGKLARFRVLGLAAAFVVTSGLGVLVAGWRDPAEVPPTVPSPTTPTETPTSRDVTRFSSPLHGYSLSYPAEWTVTPATEPLAGAVSWQTLGASADVFSSGPIATVSWVRPWFAARAIAVTPGVTAAEWARSHVRNRPEQQPASDDASVICVFGRQGVPSALTDWQATTIDGEPAVLRAACGFVDAVAVVDGRAYIFSMFTSRSDGNKRDRFEAIAATIRFQANQPSPDPLPFTSELYGYTLSYPADWVASAASEMWSGVTWLSRSRAADLLWAPGRGASDSSPWLTVKAVAVTPGTTTASWTAEWLGRRAELEELPSGERRCRSDGSAQAGTTWTDAWETGSIGGQPALVRAACGFVDAVVVLESRAFIFSVFSAPDGGTDTALFDRIASTVVFRLGRLPSGSESDATFNSPRYGYSLTLPAGWVGWPSSEQWVPGVNGRDVTSDRFSSPGGRSLVTIASVAIPLDRSTEDWIASYLPPRRRDGLGACNGWGRVFGSGPERWSAATIGGRAGQTRAACGYADGVVIVGRRAYVITVHGGFKYDGASDATLATFRDFIEAIRLEPGSAIGS